MRRLLIAAVLAVGLTACTKAKPALAVTETTQEHRNTAQADTEAGHEKDSETYRGFTLDCVFHSEQEGDIHYNLYVPESYDGSVPYALYITLPGYEGLYFQGVGVNLKSEDFAFEAQKYDEQMIIVAPQLEDWGDTSARKTIALTEYFLEHYLIDRNRVYINGYSGGGETLSLVLDKRPDLYTAALMCSSKWDGGYDTITNAEVPVYFVIGDSDEYYGAEPFRQAYREIRERYEEKHLSESEISELVRLDVKPASYFKAGGVSNQHGGGGALFSRDQNVMGWLFGEHPKQNPLDSTES